MSGRLGMTGAAVGYGMVSKSYIPGKGWVSAMKVPKNELRHLASPSKYGDSNRATALWNRRADDNAHFGRFERDMDDWGDFARRHGSNHRAKGAQRPPTVLSRQTIDGFAGGSADAFALKTGGRRDPGHTFYRPGAPGHTIHHENAHVSPKRSSYRLWSITQSPRKTMREEARADYLAGGHYGRPLGGQRPNSGYEQAARSDKARRFIQNEDEPARRGQWTRPSMTNYRHVQDRMQRAGTKQFGGPR